MISYVQLGFTERSCVLSMCAFGSIGVMLSSLEYLTETATFRQSGLLAWDICRLGRRGSCSGRSAALLDALFSGQRFSALLLLRLLLAFALCVCAATTWVAITCSLAILLLSLLINLRHTFGRDGSDQMLVIVFAGLAMYFCLTERFRIYALLFVALEVTLSYLVAGYVKLISPIWRRGDAIIGVLGTRCYGAPRELRAAVRRLLPSSSRIVCWSVILFECAFPALWFAPRPVAIVLLVAGVAFHAGVAVLMGLNVFFWAFLATYPAVWFCYATLSPLARM